MILFPFSEYYWFYGAFLAFVLVLLALDLGVFHRKVHVISFKEASAWTAGWIALALLFNLGFYFFAKARFEGHPDLMTLPGFDPAAEAHRAALEFFTGYVVEKALAVDNIFVFAVVFSYFGIPALYQHRVLYYGIIGALVFRAIFIYLGAVLMQYHGVVLFFGALLIFTGLKIAFEKGHGEIHPEKNWIVRGLYRVFRVHPKIEGKRLFLKKDGMTYVTPLFMALVFIEFSDIIFAIDSVPAIFAITKEPLIVFTSNIFAILGLRSMYFMLAGAIDKFRYIKYGLGAVLVFVGLKMVWLNDAFDGKFPISASLAIIGTLIGSSIIASLVMDRRSRKASLEARGKPETSGPEANPQ